MTRVAIFGVTGRMGQSLIRALDEASAGTGAGLPGGSASGGPARSFALTGALASATSTRLGRDAAFEGVPTGIAITADPAVALVGADVAIDFSLPEGLAPHAAACTAAGVPLLVGATGFDAATRGALAAAAQHIAVLIASNTSVGISVVATLVAMATAALGESYDVEIAEAHHRLKRDAPSGTALTLGEVVAHARGTTLADLAVYGRHGAAAPRTPGSIGFAVTRAGDIVGEHTVAFVGAGERIEIVHRATDRQTFARGALRAADWLQSRGPGLYTMANVLGL